MRIKELNGFLSKGRNSGDFSYIKRARDYLITHSQDVGGWGDDINQTCGLMIGNLFQSASNNIISKDYENAWDKLLSIKEAESTYSIPSAYGQQWDRQTQRVFHEILYEVTMNNKERKLEESARLLDLGKKMMGNENYAYLFINDAPNFNELNDETNKELFDDRLIRAEQNINKGSYFEAEKILYNAESQYKDNEAGLWTPKIGRADLDSKWDNLATSRFKDNLKEVNNACDIGNWLVAENLLKKADSLLIKDSKWLKQGGVDSLNGSRHKYHAAKLVYALRACHRLFNQGQIVSARDSLLSLNESVIKNSWLNSADIDSVRNFGSIIGGAFLDVSITNYQQERYMDASKNALDGLKLRGLLNTEIRGKLQNACLKGYTTEAKLLLKESNSDTASLQMVYGKIQEVLSSENRIIEDADQKLIFENLKEKIFAKECERYWEKSKAYIEEARDALEVENYISLCEKVKLSIKILEERPRCTLVKSEAQDMLAKYTPAAEYQKMRNNIEINCSNRDYQNVLIAYPKMEQFYLSASLSDLGVKYLPFDEYIKQQQDLSLLNYSIVHWFNDPNKIERVKALLVCAQQKNPLGLKALGLEIGKSLKAANASMDIMPVIEMYALSPKKVDKTFKKSIRKGFKAK